MDILVDDVTPLLWHTARSQGADRATAEDIVQTTWLKLVEHTHDISDPQAVLQWLLMTTKREAWSAVRRGRRTVPREPWEEPTSGDPTAPVAGPDPAAASEDSELASAIWQHIERLPARCQQLLRLVAFVDRPDYSVVSAALGIPVGSIGPTRGRCLAKLRLALTVGPLVGGDGMNPAHIPEDELSPASPWTPTTSAPSPWSAPTSRWSTRCPAASPSG